MTPRFAAVLALTGLAWLLPSVATRADVILIAAPAPGTDLSQIRVGDTFTINLFASSGDPGEVTLHAAVEIASFDLSHLDSASFASTATNTDLSTSPLLLVTIWTALLPGPEGISFDAANLFLTSPPEFI
jgi:hypothetical protein